MVITLLALLLLVALVLWVLNLGHQVNKRQVTQDAADATAIAGAGWVARSMNSVAQNNIAITRYLALVNVLDALPMSVHFAWLEQTAMRDALADQLSRGVGSGPSALMNEVQDMLEDFREDLEEEIEHLEPVDEFFGDFDVTQMTHYNAPGGRGQLWQAMHALDEVNLTLMENLPDLAQLNAVTGGRTNLHDDAPAGTFLVPIAPQIPFQRGRFDDFERPVKYGILPPQTDDKIVRRGPYDTVFGWHERVGECVSGHSRPPASRGPGGRGHVPIGSGAGGSGGGWVCDQWDYTHYRTWGTQEWMLDRVSHFTWQHLRNSRLNGWTRRIADAKIRYLWPNSIDRSGDDIPEEGEIEIAEIREPDWVIDFNDAVDEADAGNVHETAFFAVEIKSRYPMGHPSFMSTGSWAPDTRGGVRQPRLIRRPGWVDPRQWEAFPTVSRIVNYGWREQWSYRMYYDPEINLSPIVDNDGNPVVQTVYRIDHFYFAGVNIGERVDIGDPYQGFNPNDESAPAPTDLRHDLLPREPGPRREYLTCLAIARQGDRPQAWPSAFRGGKPYPNMVAISQIKIFNNHSWDLWTPMWRAQLEPVSDYENWLTTLGNGSGASVDVPDLDMDEVAAVQEYLNAARELAPVMLEH